MPRFNWGATKPPPGSRLILGHPLARGLVADWLFNDGSGIRANDVAGGHHALLGDGVVASMPRWSGQGLLFTGSPQYVKTPTINHNIGGGDFTFFAVANLYTLTSMGSGPGLIANGIFAPALLVRKETGIVTVYWAGFRNFQTALVTGRKYLVTVTRTGSLLRAFIDEKQDPVSFSISTSMANAVSWIGSSGQILDGCTGVIERAGMYSRALLPDEVAQLAAQPYCMIEGPSSRKYFIFGGEISAGIGYRIHMPFTSRQAQPVALASRAAASLPFSSRVRTLVPFHSQEDA